MKKILVISPHFPPVNAADMHRVRQSLPYFEKHGWQPTVLCVAAEAVEMGKDPLLKESIPNHIPVHEVAAFSTRYTRKVGLGNLGIRAFWQLYQKGNELLKQQQFDLIYFSTTVFACMPLGRIWKKKFDIPFVIDMQDPWRNDYYLTVPKEERHPKFWFSYRLDKYLEAFTIPKAAGLISVSKGYLTTLKERYPSIEEIPEKVLTFGAAKKDFEVVAAQQFPDFFKNDKDKINVIYVGRGGHDMQDSLSLIFNTIQQNSAQHPLLKKLKFYFIGTSYAADGKGEKTIIPIAQKYDLENAVVEITDRKPYFEALSILKQADFILIPGSNDKNYTASKLYPNILAEKPLLCIFHSNSSVVAIVKSLNAGEVVLFNEKDAVQHCLETLLKIIQKLPYRPATNWDAFQPFTADAMTKAQVDLFDMVLKK